jgi:hypothetical protein
LLARTTGGGDRWFAIAAHSEEWFLARTSGKGAVGGKRAAIAQQVIASSRQLVCDGLERDQTLFLRLVALVPRNKRPE